MQAASMVPFLPVVVQVPLFVAPMARVVAFAVPRPRYVHGSVHASELILVSNHAQPVHIRPSSLVLLVFHPYRLRIF